MSADELELTFVRCSNCKSLMPSAAEKCGMCGFQRGEESTAKSRQRLRQQSDINISDSSSSENIVEKHVDSEKPNLKESTREKTEHKEDNFRFKFSKSESENKREYLNLNSTKPQSKTESEGGWKKFDSNNGEEDYHDDGDEESDEAFDDHSDLENDPRENKFELGNENLDERPKKRKRRKKKKPRQALFDEHSNNEIRSLTPRSSGQNVQNETSTSGDSFATSRATLETTNRSPQILQERRLNEMETLKPKGQELREPIRYEERRDSDFQNNSRNETKKEDQYRSSAVDQEIPTPKRDHVEGRLLGWLVNYSMNGKGVSFELRSGRRFVGRQPLRQDDLVIPDSALSTPHSLLQVEDGQVFIQDLMSENGTFVKPANSNEFHKKDASVKLSHGDIVKFGSYELIVCLVPNR